MDAESLKKIVVIGPESTGKSTLCRQLAAHYHTEWVPEFAREYLLENGVKYTYDDLLVIAKGQLAQEDRIALTQAARANIQSPYLFVDTDMYVMKVWCEYVFGDCHKWILQQIAARKYDYYLLCNTDLPWVKDELREYPDPVTRQSLFYIYKDILINQSVPWAEIKGNNEARLQQAVQQIDSHFQ